MAETKEELLYLYTKRILGVPVVPEEVAIKLDALWDLYSGRNEIPRQALGGCVLQWAAEYRAKEYAEEARVETCSDDGFSLFHQPGQVPTVPKQAPDQSRRRRRSERPAAPENVSRQVAEPRKAVVNATGATGGVPRSTGDFGSRNG